MPEDLVECACCRAMRSKRRSRGIHVGARGVQYVCVSCRRLSFNEVMDALIRGPVYVRGTIYKTLAEMEKAMNDAGV